MFYGYKDDYHRNPVDAKKIFVIGALLILMVTIFIFTLSNIESVLND